MLPVNKFTILSIACLLSLVPAVIYLFSDRWGTFLTTLFGLAVAIPPFIVWLCTPEHEAERRHATSQSSQLKAADVLGGFVVASCISGVSLGTAILLLLYTRNSSSTFGMRWLTLGINYGPISYPGAMLLSGAYAGIVGGAVAAWFEVLAYFLEVRHILQSMNDSIWNHKSRFASVFIPIALFVLLAGSVLGICLQGAAVIMSRGLFPVPIQLVLGGIIGGLIAGIILGPIAGWEFGRKRLPLANPIASMMAAIPGLTVFVTLVAGSREEAPSAYDQYVAIMAIIICGAAGLIIRTLGEAIGMDTYIMKYFAAWTKPKLLIGGMLFGALCGVSFGISVGISEAIARLAKAG